MGYSTLFPYITIGSIAAIVVGFVIYKMARKPKIVIIEGKLTVNVLKSNIDGNGDYSLMTRGALKDVLRANTSVGKYIKNKQGYDLSMIALLADDTRKLRNIVFFYSKGFDDDVNSMIGNDDVAVISV